MGVVVAPFFAQGAGELALASAMAEGLDPDEMLAGSLGGANPKQKKREAQCALNLAAKLAPS